jgi:hypothetical protein
MKSLFMITHWRIMKYSSTIVPVLKNPKNAIGKKWTEMYSGIPAS